MARKPIDAILAGGQGESGGARLSKTLGAFSITAMGIGAIIGAYSPGRRRRATTSWSKGVWDEKL